MCFALELGPNSASASGAKVTCKCLSVSQQQIATGTLYIGKTLLWSLLRQLHCIVDVPWCAVVTLRRGLASEPTNLKDYKYT